jgi:hypothetical protein
MVGQKEVEENRSDHLDTLHWTTNFYWRYGSEVIVAISYQFRGAEHEYNHENSKLGMVSKKSANVYIFKKYVHQTFNDKSPLLLATSLCLSRCVRNEGCVK